MSQSHDWTLAERVDRALRLNDYGGMKGLKQLVRELEQQNQAVRESVLSIAGIVNTYHNDGTTLTAAETLRAIADELGKPMEPEAP